MNEVIHQQNGNTGAGFPGEQHQLENSVPLRGVLFLPLNEVDNGRLEVAVSDSLEAKTIYLAPEGEWPNTANIPDGELTTLGEKTTQGDLCTEPRVRVDVVVWVQPEVATFVQQHAAQNGGVVDFTFPRFSGRVTDVSIPDSSISSHATGYENVQAEVNKAVAAKELIHTLSLRDGDAQMNMNTEIVSALIGPKGLLLDDSMHLPPRTMSMVVAEMLHACVKAGFSWNEITVVAKVAIEQAQKDMKRAEWLPGIKPAGCISRVGGNVRAALEAAGVSENKITIWCNLTKDLFNHATYSPGAYTMSSYGGPHELSSMLPSDKPSRQYFDLQSACRDIMMDLQHEVLNADELQALDDYSKRGLCQKVVDAVEDSINEVINSEVQHAIIQYHSFTRGCEHVCNIIQTAFDNACTTVNDALTSQGMSSPSIKTATSACFQAIGKFVGTAIRESWAVIKEDGEHSNNFHQPMPKNHVDIRSNQDVDMNGVCTESQEIEDEEID